jgi:hypothetical protein
MSYTIPIEVYEKLEARLGKETAFVVVEVLQKSVKESIEESEDKLKIKISEDLKKELASKYDIELLKKDIERVEIDLRKEIDMLRLEIRKDMKIMTVIIVAVVIILNQNSLEFLLKVMGLLK